MEFLEWYENGLSFLRGWIISRMPEEGNEAEDIFQEVCRIALEQWDLLAEHPNRNGWAIQTAKHLMEHQRRRGSLWKPLGETESSADMIEGRGRRKADDAFWDLEEAYVEQLWLTEMLKTDEDGWILLARGIGGYSYRELEAETWIPAATLRKRGERARERIRKHLQF